MSHIRYLAAFVALGSARATTLPAVAGSPSSLTQTCKNPGTTSPP